VNAYIFPDRTEFYYPMNITAMKIRLDDLDKDYDYINGTIVIEEDDYRLTVSNTSAVVECKEPIIGCINPSHYRVILDDLESWKAFDLSKTEKDIISGFYGRNVVIKKMGMKEYILTVIRSGIMSILGKFFCVSYEVVTRCIDDWCGMNVIHSEKCPYALLGG